MNADQELSRSLWMEKTIQPFPPLQNDAKTKVLVIGAGISGLSTAYELARARTDVIVVDRGGIGGGMTARTTAHLSYEPDDFYHGLISVRGEKEARHYFESQKAAVERIEDITKNEAIPCDFKRVDLFLFAPDKEGRQTLEKEYKAVQRVGFSGVDWAEAPIAGHSEGCLRFPNQARFHPIKYIAGLVKTLKGMGAQIYANTPIVSVEENGGRIVATTEAGNTITANAAVLASNTPFVDPIAIHTKQAPYRTYVIAGTMEKGSIPDALIWDTLDPYHYVRIQRQGTEQLAIIGGEDHKSGTGDDGKARMKRLERWARKRFPGFGEVRYGWSGQVYEPVDYVQFIGRNPGHKHIYLVSGDSGSGITMGVAASLILPDLIADRKNLWADIYSPSRKPKNISTLATFVGENVGAAGHLVQRALPLSGSEPNRHSTGKVVSHRGKKLAVYRDEKGVMHRMSASCTHMGCIVQWNSFERCWDCPCHGSQFAPTGEPLQGPAVKPLTPVEEKRRQKHSKP
jgi:hypothetical protein